MTSWKQIAANRSNARKSTGPQTDEGKQRSRCNAVRHGLTAETVISGLEDAQDYKSFEDAIIADYDAQSGVERELVLRLASLLWRVRRATAIETGLFGIHTEHLRRFRRIRDPVSPEPIHPTYGLRSSDELPKPDALLEIVPDSLGQSESSVDIARTFLRVANLPNFAIDRLSRYETTLWRQVAQVLYVLDSLDRRKPQERRPFAKVQSQRPLPPETSKFR
jgi:hypothetical protein